MAINLTFCIKKVYMTTQTIIKDWRDYCRGMAEYARFNNVGSNRENSWQSVVNEMNECKQAFQQSQMTETIHEFIDVVHAVIKHLVVTYLPYEWYCKSSFWILIFPLVFPVAIKLAHRYQQFGCIRNHKNPNNCGHICSLRKYPLKIYYAVSVRGSDSLVTKQDVVAQIEFLKGFGEVLTEHLASSDPQVIDMQGAQDEDIFIKDMKLIADCDVFIADVTAPSLGVGFVIGEALRLNKPVFCLQKQAGRDQKKKLSAMINGHPLVAKSDYFDQTTYEISIKRFLVDLHERSLLPHVELKSNGLKIFLAGPPGSGKSTVGKGLAQKWGLVFISGGDICRKIVKDLTHPLAEKVRSFMDKGSLVPASVMKELIINRLQQSDCQILGYVLDGYPPSQDDLDNLLQAQIQPDLLFLFKCEDSTAVARQCSRGDRITDEFSTATHRVAVFHQNLPNFSTFKKTPVITVDADQTADVVESYVKSTVSNWIDPPKTSYFPVPPTATQSLSSTRFHFHIDADNNKQLINIAKLVYATHADLAGQMKIYPIQYLHLGKQAQSLPAYERMVNFHEIDNSKTEAFVTGRMGLAYNPEMMSAVLQSCRNSAQAGIGSAAELEQYLGEWQRTPDGIELVDSQYEEQVVELPEEFTQYLISQVPPYELHHGFNILKSDFPNQPIDLEELTMRCNEKGFNTGGWFIFSNDDHWSYRSNEFSNLTASEARTLLCQQAIGLQSILFNYGYDDINVMYSLERVHGIYRFDQI